jgi:acetyl/propionyl-CoA carboxylase alpha subunit
VAAGKAIGYVGAGTVEFVLDRSGSFYFLEVNTRLQVEHPVTELVTGLDLVALQLLVAEGQPLPDEARVPSLSGHAVEARLYAEDVPAGFLPAAGTVHTFEIPPLPGVRVDAGVADGSQVSVHYDPMLAKVIAHGGTREQACRKLARALAEARLHGIVTNRDLLVGILRDPEFRAGATDTGYLTRHDPQQLARSWRDPQAARIHAVAAALAGQAERRAQAPVLATVPSGWRNVPSAPQQVTFALDGAEIAVRYRFTGPGPGPGTGAGGRVEAEADGEPVDLVLRSAEPGRVIADIAGIRREISVRRVGDVYYLDSHLGATALTELPRFPEPESRVAPGSLLAPMPGTVTRVGGQPGDGVTAGTTVVVLEAMKMEHSIRAPHDGVLCEILVTVGQAVGTGTVLAVVEEPQ